MAQMFCCSSCTVKVQQLGNVQCFLVAMLSVAVKEHFCTYSDKNVGFVRVQKCKGRGFVPYDVIHSILGLILYFSFLVCVYLQVMVCLLCQQIRNETKKTNKKKTC